MLNFTGLAEFCRDFDFLKKCLKLTVEATIGPLLFATRGHSIKVKYARWFWTQSIILDVIVMPFSAPSSVKLKGARSLAYLK